MKEDGSVPPSASALGRRDILKMGAATVVGTTLGAPKALTQSSAPQHELGVTHAGYKNDSGRSFGNGPIDNTTRQLVAYANSFSETNLTEAIVERLGYTLLDSMGCLIAGFESKPARICARIARANQSDLKCTVLGYGITTSPEAAAFANTTMMRHNDFNDEGVGNHSSDMIPGILAIGEAFHASGPQVLAAIVLTYELQYALEKADITGGWDGPYLGPATALAAAKMIGLGEDRMANALSLALVPNIPLRVSRSGALSMWKGCHSAAAVRSGVFAVLLAREGMTGPGQPFEARNGVWEKMSGPYKNLRLPVSPDGRLAVQLANFKRFPSEGSTQSLLELIPEIRAWTGVENIASVQVELSHASWQEVGDPPKWDPRNSETADHSMPFVMAVALTDGEVSLSSFTPERYLEDRGLRLLMEKITVKENPDFGYHRGRITVRTKAGAELVKDGYHEAAMSYPEINAKFDRNCAFRSVSDEVRDRTRATWTNLRAVRDIAEPMRGLAHFGRPLAL